MIDQLRILAWLHIVLAGLTILGGGIAFVVLVLIGGTAAVATGGSDEGAMAAGTLALIGTIAGIWVLLVGLPGLLAGIGLLKFRQWARILAIVLAVLQVLNFPVGTALAVYTFVVLFNKEVADAFNNQPYGLAA